MFVADNTRPTLESFDIDFDRETLTLTFSETVRVTTLDVTQITLHEDTAGGQEYTLTNGSVLTTNDPVVIFRISKQVSLKRVWCTTHHLDAQHESCKSTNPAKARILQKHKSCKSTNPAKALEQWIISGLQYSDTRR